MKKCKSCQTEIDDKAKKCPHCQTDQRNWFLRHPIWTGILALMVISAVGSATGSSKSSQPSSSVPTAQTTSSVTQTRQVANPTPEALAQIGQTVTDGELAFTVKGIKTAQSLGSYYVKKPQGVFYIVTIEVKNMANETKMIDSSGFKIADNQNRQYDRSIEGQTAMGMSNGQMDLFLQQIQPSLGIEGEIVFDIPKEATGLKLIAKGSLFSSGKQIDLGQ